MERPIVAKSTKLPVKSIRWVLAILGMVAEAVAVTISLILATPITSLIFVSIGAVNFYRQPAKCCFMVGNL